MHGDHLPRRNDTAERRLAVERERHQPWIVVHRDQPHPIVEFFDAETRGLIVAKYTEEKTWKG